MSDNYQITACFELTVYTCRDCKRTCEKIGMLDRDILDIIIHIKLRYHDYTTMTLLIIFGTDRIRKKQISLSASII